jgi:hypothetical protein
MKEKMKKRILALVAVLALGGALMPGIVFAAQTGTVTCTVSAVLVSVTVAPGSVAYGTLALGANITTIALNDTQTATNTGTVAEDFNIESSNATRGGGTDWTLMTGAPGSNQFKHEFSINAGSNWTAMTNSYASLKTNVASNSSQTFDLRITMPGSTTDYLEHTITVTVQAVQH